MNKIFKLLLILVMTMTITPAITSCGDNDEPASANSPSYRDGIYTGQYLKFTINGDSTIAIKSVSLSSTLLSTNATTPSDSSIAGSTNPEYSTTVTLNGYPKRKSKTKFTTKSDLIGFYGTTTINGVTYDYVGEFIGDPLEGYNALTGYQTSKLVLTLSKK